MNENWKTLNIKGFEPFYEISNKGNVRSKLTNKICSQHIRNGYKATSIYNPNLKKSKTCNIHRLVALTFINNDNPKYIVNHINGNKLDNKVKNLEWVSYKGNYKHARENKLFVPHSKKVKQYTLDGKLINTFKSIKYASQVTGAWDRHISAVCKGKRKTTGGYIWKYENDHCNIMVDIDVKKLIKVKEYENYYADPNGKIYSKRYKKFLYPKILPSGYASVKLYKNNVGKDFYIHRIIATAYIDNKDNKPFVNHKDKNRSNNHVNNLEWVTHSENMIHCNRN